MKCYLKMTKSIMICLILFIAISYVDTVFAGAIKIGDEVLGAKSLYFFNIGDTIQLNYFNTETGFISATVNCINDDVTWESSDTSVATVDENGLVTIVGYGTTSIAAIEGNNDTQYIAITASSTEINRIILYLDDLNISPSFRYFVQENTDPILFPIIGSSFQLKYRNNGSIINTSSDNITWESTDPAAISIDENGLVNVIGQSSTFAPISVKAYLSGELVEKIDLVPLLFEGCEVKSSSTTYATGVSASGIGEQLVEVPNTGSKVILTSVILGVFLLVIGIGTLTYIKTKSYKN